MNRTELADKLSKRTGLSKINADKLAVAFCDVVSTSMKASDRLVFSNFGTFHIVRYPEKTLHHPGTGKKMIIPPQNIIKWLPSEHLKKVIRGEERSDGNVILHGSKKFRQDYETKDEFTSEEYIIPIKIIRNNFAFENEDSEDEVTEIAINVTTTPGQQERELTAPSDELPDAEILFFKNLAENFHKDEPVDEPKTRNISATEVTISDASQKQEAVEELVEYMDQNNIPYEEITTKTEEPIHLTTDPVTIVSAASPIAIPEIIIEKPIVETIAKAPKKQNTIKKLVSNTEEPIRLTTDPVEIDSATPLAEIPEIPIEDPVVAETPVIPVDMIDPAIVNDNISLNIENVYLESIRKARPSLWKQLFGRKNDMEFETRPKVRRKEISISPFLLHNQIAGNVILNKPDIWLDSKITDMLPYSLIQKHKVVPVGYNNSYLLVLMSDPFDYDAIFEIKRYVRNILPVISSIEDIDRLINEIPIKENTAARKLPNNKLSPARLFDSILKRAVRLNAHTIEITSGAKDAFISYKRDEVLKEYRIDEKAFSPILSRVKKLSRTEKPNQSHFVVNFDNSKHEFIASVLQTSNKEKINIKVLY